MSEKESGSSETDQVRKCEVCGKKVSENENFEFVECSMSPTQRLQVCGSCLTLLANHEWEKLSELLEANVNE